MVGVEWQGFNEMDKTTAGCKVEAIEPDVSADCCGEACKWEGGSWEEGVRREGGKEGSSKQVRRGEQRGGEGMGSDRGRGPTVNDHLASPIRACAVAFEYHVEDVLEVLRFPPLAHRDFM